MKPLLLLPVLTILLFSAFKSFSQNQSQAGSDEYFDYSVKDVITVYEYDIATNQPIENRTKQANDGLKFYVVGAERSNTSGTIKYYLIRFYRITGESQFLANDPLIINSTNSAYTQYCIKSEDFENENLVTKHYRTGLKSVKLSASVLSIPFKIRPKLGKVPADFTGDFTIGSAIGIGFRLSPYKKNYLNLSLAGGVTSVTVDRRSTNNYVNEKTKWSALSPGFGLTFDINGFQFGGVIGCDFVGGEAGSKWIYNNSFWYSIGVGYQFIKPKD